MKLALGSAQFGMRYGISNQLGQTEVDEVAAILSQASGGGIDTIDTAFSYGTSETVLGEIGVSDWNIISKLPPMSAASGDFSTTMNQHLKTSMQRLRVSRLKGLLLHRGSDLLHSSGPKIYATLLSMRNAGFVEKIGVSVYTPSELEKIMNRFPLDLVQLPLSIIDQTAITTGILGKLKAAGVEVHVRSIFLQGLLLMEASTRPNYFSRWASLWEQWHIWLKAEKLTPLQACLRFTQSRHEVDKVVIGVENTTQLTEILDAANGHSTSVPDGLASTDPALIHPSHWQIG